MTATPHRWTWRCLKGAQGRIKDDRSGWQGRTEFHRNRVWGRRLQEGQVLRRQRRRRRRQPQHPEHRRRQDEPRILQAVALGIMCNALVCLAVWLCFSAHSTTDKIVAIILPITAFVAAGFEHSVANMYFIPMGLLVKTWGDPAFLGTVGITAAAFPHLTWLNFVVANLLPVTIGNIIGGAGMVGIVYWFIYLRPKTAPAIPHRRRAPSLSGAGEWATEAQPSGGRLASPLPAEPQEGQRVAY